MTRVTLRTLSRTALLAGHLSTRAINVTPSSRYTAPLAFAYASVKGSNRVMKPGSVFTRAFSPRGKTTKLHVEFIETEKERKRKEEREETKERENQETPTVVIPGSVEPPSETVSRHILVFHGTVITTPRSPLCVRSSAHSHPHSRV